MEQLALPGIGETTFLPRAKAKPIIKWAGGKAWLVPYLAPGIYRKLAVTGGRYIEPFLGGGALALDLGLPGMILGDACEPLCAMYQTVVAHPMPVAWALSTLATQGVDEKTYYHVRDARPRAPILAAARFIYLNRLGYNGLYRENTKGEYNVPYGDQVHRKSATTRADAGLVDTLFPSGGKLMALARTFATADLDFGDFAATLSYARAGDVIFADPPYMGVFGSYTARGFPPADQARLAFALREAHEHGAIIVATNADHPEIRALYAWAHVMSTAEARAISQDGANRQRAQTLLITTGMEILGT